MDEFISREATIKRIKEVYCVGCNSYHGVRCRACGTGDAIDMIEDAPAADVVPVVHGRWLYNSYPTVWYGSGEPPELVCSECEERAYNTYNYCPNCGAKMDGGDSDEAD